MDQRQRHQTYFSREHQAFQSAKELPLVNPGCDLAERNLRVAYDRTGRRCSCDLPRSRQGFRHTGSSEGTSFDCCQRRPCFSPVLG